MGVSQSSHGAALAGGTPEALCRGQQGLDGLRQDTEASAALALRPPARLVPRQWSAPAMGGAGACGQRPGCLQQVHTGPA